MDIVEATERIKDLLFSWGLDMTSSQIEGQFGYIYSPVSIEPYTHHIDILIGLGENDTMRVDFIMGEINANEDVYELLNQFNVDVPQYKAVIIGGQLHIVTYCEDGILENIEQRIENAMNDIGDEDYMYEPMKGLLEYIVPEEEDVSTEA